MTVTRSLVSVVDDDESVRESLPDLLKEFGFAARAFSSPEEFLASDCFGQTKCLILDIAMPGMSGPDLQRELKLRRQEIPIIFITASTDRAVRPRLLEQGAVECLFKPFSDTALLEALNTALGVNWAIGTLKRAWAALACPRRVSFDPPFWVATLIQRLMVADAKVSPIPSSNWFAGAPRV
jgi:FixJ family two-component response regulator